MTHFSSVERRSSSTMIRAGSGASTWGFQPSTRAAFDGSPMSESTSVDLRYRLSNVTYFSQSRPACSKANRRKSRTVGSAGSHDVVRSLVLLEPSPHGIHVLGGVSPVAGGVDVAHVEGLGEASFDASDTPGDLARHERLATARALVVEQDPVDPSPPPSS